jgi:hypothetical protein
MELVTTALVNSLMPNCNAPFNFLLKKSVPHMVTGDLVTFHHSHCHPLGQSHPWLTGPRIQILNHRN